MAPLPLTGGCLCGQVRYRIARPGPAYWCHCTLCRRNSGADALPWVTVAREDFTLTSGTLSAYASSPGTLRRFCGTCGGVLVFDMAAEEAIDVAIGTLDAPDDCPPTFHIWTRSALKMSAGLGAGLPRYEKERPEDDGA